MQLSTSEFYLRREQTTVGAGSDFFIDEIQAKIEGPKLLKMKIKSVLSSNEEPMPFVQELTYSGSFTIWWSEPEK